jgi:hypothetical protein
MKYYIGKIEELNGEFVYNDMYLFKTEGDPHEFTDMNAREWRSGTKWDADQEGWWCDHTLIFNDGYTEIPEADYIVLNKYLPTMTA